MKNDFRGTIITPEDSDYDDARSIYNGMIDKRPKFIARCANAGDVMTAVNYGRKQGLHTAIRSGGHGYLSRKHGLTIDNLLSADVVLANGDFVHASTDENPDLFWALRGGGNFGVVTSFEYRLHPVKNVIAEPLFEFTGKMPYPALH